MIELNDLVVTFVRYGMDDLASTIVYLNDVADNFTRDSMDDYITDFQKQIKNNKN